MPQQQVSQKAIIITLMVTIVVDVMGVGLILPILPELFFTKHSVLLGAHVSETWRYWAYAIVIGVWPLGLMFGAPFIGDVSDKIGRKKTLILFLGLTALMYALGAVALVIRSYWLFVLSRLLSGFVAGSFEIAQATVADISSNKDKARNLGYITFAGSLGFIAGPMITSFSASGWFAFSSIQMPFWIATVLSLANVIGIIVLLKETFPPQPRASLSLLRAVSAISFLFKDQRVRYLGLLFVLLQIGWGFYLQGVPLVLKITFGMGTAQIGLFFCVIGLSVAASSLIIQPWLLKRLSLKPLYMLGALLTGVIIALSCLFTQPWVAWLTVVLVGIIELFAYTSIMALFSYAVTENEQGKVMGSAGAGFGLSWFINAMLLGAMTNITVLLPLLGAAVALLLSGAGMYFYQTSR